MYSPYEADNRHWLVAGCIILILIGVLLSSLTEDRGLSPAEKEYCEMVDLWRKHPGENIGWPDYKNIYGDLCMPKR